MKRLNQHLCVEQGKKRQVLANTLHGQLPTQTAKSKQLSKMALGMVIGIVRTREKW
jgi:hypothetical protein